MSSHVSGLAVVLLFPTRWDRYDIVVCCRFVLVFNCDEHFDFKAMGRIFVGLCQVGAWGCFDEFNRLEERILSAVSSQILAIQTALLREVGRSCDCLLMLMLILFA